VLEKSTLKSEVEILDISPHLKPFTVGACTISKNRRNPVVQSFWNIVEQEMIRNSQDPL
jgi:LysR family transcriptional regulator, positive regulator for ilvC